MRKDVRSAKRQIIAANMRLTDQEAEKFWPVYDKYSKDITKINDEKYQLIKQYAKSVDSMTDDRLDQTVKDWLKLDQSTTQLRVKYLPMFRSVIPAKSVARFYQLDKRIGNLIELQIPPVSRWCNPKGEHVVCGFRTGCGAAFDATFCAAQTAVTANWGAYE